MKNIINLSIQVIIGLLILIFLEWCYEIGNYLSGHEWVAIFFVAFGVILTVLMMYLLTRYTKLYDRRRKYLRSIK